MDVFEAIRERRSIRKYTDEPVSDEVVRELLGAAMMAPTAGNAQAWQFVVIRDRAMLESVQSFSPYAGMAAQAPLGILICGDTALEKYPGYWVQDCAAAMQNLLLAVHAKGLGAVWTGVHPKPEREAGFRKLCALPDNVMPLGFAVIGHPAQERQSEDRFNPQRVHLDVYGKTLA
ncbi:MAG: nitroreductase family protein [Desulfovibrio sp.]|nr:nitroreductase family protein [Desulfovibrio sp.]